MTLNSLFLIQRLQELQQNIADAPRFVESLREALNSQELGAVFRARMYAERHLRDLEMIAGHIKAQVVPADDLGDALESLSELALRAARMVLLAELTTLRKVVSDLVALAEGLDGSATQGGALLDAARVPPADLACFAWLARAAIAAIGGAVIALLSGVIARNRT